MRSELVSVILPTFNRAYCLRAAIDSVRAQSHPDWELIVVDDGSTDETSILMSRYEGDRRVRYLRQANAGVSAARNAGLNLARGQFIAFLDSDDAWKPFKLRLQLDVLRALPAVGMVWTEMEAVRPDGHLQSPAHLAVMYGNYQRFPKSELFHARVTLGELLPETSVPTPTAAVYSGSIFSAMIAGNLVHTSTVLMRRETTQRVGSFNEELQHTGEDFDFHLRTCREGPVALIDMATIAYMTGRDDQLTRAGLQDQMAMNYLRAIDPMIEQFRDRLRWTDRELRGLRADAYTWAGMDCYYDGRYRQARQHFLSSLKQQWDWRVHVYYGLTSLPRPALHAARQTVRALRRPAASHGPAAPDPDSSTLAV